MAEHVATEIAQVVPAHYEIVDDRQSVRRLVLSNAVHHSSQHVGAGDAQGFFDIFGFDFLAGEADHLIESRLRIAHRAVAGAGNLANCFVGNGDLFRFRD